MKILVTGATGFIGSHLTRRLEAGGHKVMAVSRRPGADYDWSEAGLARGVRDSDAVVNLAGENLIGKRWSPMQKQILQSSRFETTKRLAALVAARKPAAFVSASAIGYYGASNDAAFNEGSSKGRGFLADLCAGWESATATAREAGVRTAIVRIGVVLGSDGGALKKMLLPFKLGLGGPVGDGKQWLSWIHVDDLTSLIAFLIENPKTEGVFNGTAPNPVTMRNFATALGRALHRPAILPVPAPVLRLALGEAADVLLTGQNVESRRTREAGFQFRFTDLDAALRDIVSRKPSTDHSSTLRRPA